MKKTIEIETYEVINITEYARQVTYALFEIFYADKTQTSIREKGFNMNFKFITSESIDEKLEDILNKLDNISEELKRK